MWVIKKYKIEGFLFSFAIVYTCSVKIGGGGYTISGHEFQ